MPYKDKEKERKAKKKYRLLHLEEIRIKKRQYRILNDKKIKAKKKIYHIKNRVRINEKSKLYRIKNRALLRIKDSIRNKSQKRRLYWRVRYTKNRGKLLEQKREYHQRNKHKRSAYRKKYKNTINGRIIIRLNNLKRKSKIKRVSDGSINHGAIMKKLVEQNMKCVYCPKNIKINFHIDHKTPLIRGGKHTISNAQLLCPPCNLRKKHRTHREFLHILKNQKKVK